MDKLCSCGNVPCVIVPGIGQCEVYQTGTDGSRIRTVFPFDINAKALVAKVAPRALAMIAFRRDLGFSDALADALIDQIGGIICKPDGTPVFDLKTVTFDYSLAECSKAERKFIFTMVPIQPLEDKIGADHIYYYAYNPFGRADEAADGLHDFIQLVKRRTGHEKVNIVPVSLGGTIAEYYLGRYADRGDINRVVSVVPAYGGSQLLADIFTDNLLYDSYEEAFTSMLGRGTTEEVKKYLGIVPKDVFNKILHTVMRAVVERVCMNSSVIWGLIPASQYEELSARMISDPAHAELKKVTDEAYAYRRDFPQIVDRLRGQGVVFEDVCCHGVRILEFSSSKSLDSDHIVHTHSSSMGAVCAPLGETLPEDYKPAGTGCSNPEHNHISPCRTVDASAGMIPDTTWYFKGQSHDTVQYCKTVLDALEWLLSDEKEKTVFSDPRYPQFTVIENPV